MLKLKFNRHFFHLVDASPMPLLTALSVFCVAVGNVLFFHGFFGGLETLIFGIFCTFVCSFLWWRDVVRESLLQGCHTTFVQLGLRYSMILFIVSEILFFFAFFWAFFASSLSPTIDIGGIWPPKGITPFASTEIPLLNTIILLTSGATITYSHHSFICGKKKQAIIGLFLTICLAIIFTAFQGFEYYTALFTISDSIFGSTFFMATGFHGFHVLLGTIFISVCLFRLFFDHFSTNHHFGFEASAFYWHFVDVVWLFLYVSVYFWGGF